MFCSGGESNRKTLAAGCSNQAAVVDSLQPSTVLQQTSDIMAGWLMVQKVFSPDSRGSAGLVSMVRYFSSMYTLCCFVCECYAAMRSDTACSLRTATTASSPTKQCSALRSISFEAVAHLRFNAVVRLKRGRKGKKLWSFLYEEVFLPLPLSSPQELNFQIGLMIISNYLFGLQE